MTYNEISVSKTEFQLELATAGIDVLAYVPERLVPPVVVMNAGSPYMLIASLGSEYVLNLTLNLVVPRADNSVEQEELDSLIEKTINALPAYALLKSVDKPYILQANNAEYFACDMQVELQITI